MLSTSSILSAVLALSLATTSTLAAPPKAATTSDSSTNDAIRKPIWEAAPSDSSLGGIVINLSTISPTFYGRPSDNFDYHLAGYEFESAIETAETLAKVFPRADPDGVELLVAFLNAWTGGYEASKHADDMEWLCNDLGPKMGKFTKLCDGARYQDWGRKEM